MDQLGRGPWPLAPEPASQDTEAAKLSSCYPNGPKTAENGQLANKSGNERDLLTRCRDGVTAGPTELPRRDSNPRPGD